MSLPIVSVRCPILADRYDICIAPPIDGLTSPTRILQSVADLIYTPVRGLVHSVPILHHRSQSSKSCIHHTLPSPKKTRRTHIFSQTTRKSQINMSTSANHPSLAEICLAYPLSRKQESYKCRTIHVMAGASPLRFFLPSFKIGSDLRQSHRSHYIRPDSLTA
jgi:hypothetical protein